VIEPGGKRITVGIDRFLHEPQQRGSLFVGKLKVRHSEDSIEVAAGRRYTLGFWSGS
jgi:hypothetical protein